MIRGPNTLPPPLNTLVIKALKLCELMLPVCQYIHPFAATYENGKIKCLFNDNTPPCLNESNAIEQLQWKINNITTDTMHYGIVVYAAKVETKKNTTLNAIAINITSPTDGEQLQLYPYYRIGNKIVVSPPINTMPE